VRIEKKIRSENRGVRIEKKIRGVRIERRSNNREALEEDI
jgi:hypothetical protein